MADKSEKNTSERSESTPKFDYKECYNCSCKIQIVGKKFCSNYCKENYSKKLKEKFA
jgi:hypothetical protein